MDHQEAEESEVTVRQETKRRVRIMPIIAIAIVVIVIIAVIAFILPGQSSKLQKENYNTATALAKAVEIDNLATAEFIYNGIAEHYREEGQARNPLLFWKSDDPVDYRVCYKATVKAGIDMRNVQFSVDEPNKAITVKLPEISLTSKVDPNGMQFIPEGTDADMQAIFQLCEEDVENEARQSENLYKTAQENLRGTIEALTKPVVSSGGYTLNWEQA